MVKMDFKLKGVTWMGNFYQKFEEVCQEVDDIVGQDGVKYFVNQVQNVGDSVKRFYSDVVQEDGVKYLGNQVQNVGDTVKRFYSDVVQEDGVKYLGNQVQNVEDSVKRFYSDVQEVLPLPPLVNSVKHGHRSVALNNKVDSSLESIAAAAENKKGTEDKSVNNIIESLHDSDANNLTDNQHAQASIGLDLVNQVSDEIFSNSHEVEDSYTTQEEVGDDYSREISGVIKKTLHVSVEQNAFKLTPQLLNLMSLNDQEPLESSIFSESLSGSNDSGYGALAGTENNSDVAWAQNSCTIVEENAMKWSTSQVLKLMLSQKESLDISIFSEHFDGDDESSCGILDEVSTVTCLSNMKSQSSPKAGTVNYNIAARDQYLYGSESSDSLTSSEVAYSTVSSEMPMMNVEPLCFKSPLMSESDSLSAKSPESYCFELDSCKDNSVDVAGCCTLDSSMVLVSCTTTPDVDVVGQFMTSQAGLLSCGSSQSMKSNEGETSGVNEVMSFNNSSGIKIGQISSAQDRAIISLSEIDESLVNSIESSKEDIQFSDDVKLEESCVIVDDSELHAVSCRAQRLRSYKKRIKDAFAPKKRLEKEYEQLAIWYGDSDMESSEGTLQTVMPFSPRRSLDSKNLQVQHSCETEWELL